MNTTRNSDADEKAVVGEMPAIERMVVHWYGTVEKVGKNLTSYSRVVFLTDSTLFVCLPSGGVTRSVPLSAIFLAYRIPGGVSQVYERGGPPLVLRHESDVARDDFLGAARAAKSIVAPGQWIDIHDAPSLQIDASSAPVEPRTAGDTIDPDAADRDSSLGFRFTLASPTSANRTESPSIPDAAAGSSRSQSPATARRLQPPGLDGNRAGPLAERSRSGGAPVSAEPAPRARANSSPARQQSLTASSTANPIHRFADPLSSAMGPLSPPSSTMGNQSEQTLTLSQPSLVLRDLLDAAHAPSADMVAPLPLQSASTSAPRNVIAAATSLRAPGVGQRPGRGQSVEVGAVAQPLAIETPTRVGGAKSVTFSDNNPTAASESFDSRREGRDKQLEELRAAVTSSSETAAMANLKRTVDHQQLLIEELRAQSQHDHVADLRAELQHAHNLITDLQTALRTQETTFQEMLRAQEALRVSQSIQSSQDAQLKALTAERDALRNEASGLRVEVDKLAAAADAQQRRHDRELLTVKDAFMQYDANVAEYIEELRMEHAEHLQRVLAEDRQKHHQIAARSVSERDAPATRHFIASGPNGSFAAERGVRFNDAKAKPPAAAPPAAAGPKAIEVPGAGVAPDALRDALVRHLNHYANARFQLPQDDPPPAPYDALHQAMSAAPGGTRDRAIL